MRRVLRPIACLCAALIALCGCENKLSALKRATRLAARERYTEAVQAYEHYIELVGSSPESAYERAEAYYQIGRLYTYRMAEPAKGREAFEQAVALRPDYADPEIHLGIMYMVLGLVDKGEQALRRALESRPEITEYSIQPNVVHRPRVMLARIEQQRGRLNAAIRQLYTYEHYSDDEAEGWSELGKTFVVQQDFPKALFYYQRAFKALGPAKRGTSGYFAIRFGLIEAYTQNGYLAEAQEILDESFNVLDQFESYYRRLSPTQRHEERNLRAFVLEARPNLLLQQASVCTAQQNYDEAINALREIRIRLPQAGTRLLPELADLYARKGDFAAAREQLASFKQLAPYDPRALMTEATILDAEHNYEAYIKELDEYIRVVPEATLPRALRAVGLVKAGRADEGLAQLEALCKEFPNFSPLQLKMAEAQAAAGHAALALWWVRRTMQTGLVLPTQFQTDRELRPVLDEPGFPELLRDVRYQISLRQQVYEAEDLVYRDETERGLAALARLRTQNPDVLFVTYALARADVYAGRPDDAFPLLTECAKGGLFNPTALKKDGYLTELHDDPRFAELLKAIEQPWPTAPPSE